MGRHQGEVLVEPVLPSVNETNHVDLMGPCSISLPHWLAGLKGIIH